MGHGVTLSCVSVTRVVGHVPCELQRSNAAISTIFIMDCIIWSSHKLVLVIWLFQVIISQANEEEKINAIFDLDCRFWIKS